MHGRGLCKTVRALVLCQCLPPPRGVSNAFEGLEKHSTRAERNMFYVGSHACIISAGGLLRVCFFVQEHVCHVSNVFLN